MNSKRTKVKIIVFVVLFIQYFLFLYIGCSFFIIQILIFSSVILFFIFCYLFLLLGFFSFYCFFNFILFCFIYFFHLNDFFVCLTLKKNFRICIFIYTYTYIYTHIHIYAYLHILYNLHNLQSCSPAMKHPDKISGIFCQLFFINMFI